MSLTDMKPYMVVGGLFYAAPKILNYLCTKPEEPMRNGLIDQCRVWMASTQSQTQSLVGDRVWRVTTDVIADNAWISALAILHLSQGKNLFNTTEQSAATVSAFGCFCALAFLVRFGAIKVFPPLAPYVGTRSF